MRAKMPESGPALDADAVKERLRKLPQVGAALASDALAPLVEVHGQAVVTRAIRAVLDERRGALRAGRDVVAAITGDDVEHVIAASAQSSLRPAVNATGVLVHTNLGRAPLAQEALARVVEVAGGYSSLEYDLEAGARGSRHHHASALLCELTGADDAAVVNNCAGAVLLALAALSEGKGALVSRGELVEIGGGFRVPDVMRQSGAHLVEVGTTNRTHLKDYASAIDDNTGVLLKVHQSNFAQVGFTKEVPIAELAGLAREKKVSLLVDAGSGLIDPLEGAPHEPAVKRALKDGADLVMFSGDKLLGGPQAGLLVGKAALVEQVRAHPLMRALRPDKMAIAALVETLRLLRDHPERVPLHAALHAPIDVVEARARALVSRCMHPRATLRVVKTEAKIGGGTSPLVTVESRAVRVDDVSAERLHAALRTGDDAVVGRIEDDALLLDVRSVSDDEVATVARALNTALAALLPTGDRDG
jgi:L-seryl-tRNA(Ser) seleniumtransferase